MDGTSDTWRYMLISALCRLLVEHVTPAEWHALACSALLRLVRNLSSEALPRNSLKCTSALEPAGVIGQRPSRRIELIISSFCRNYPNRFNREHTISVEIFPVERTFGR